MDIAKLYLRAADRFGQLLAEVKATQWSASTPDDDWDVRALVNHVVGETLWIPDLLAGKTIAEVGDRYDGDVLGDNPAQAWSKAFARAEPAVNQPDALSHTAHLSFGDVEGSEYLSQMFFDTLIHGWDLSKAIAADTKLDQQLAQAAYGWFKPQAEDWRQAGILGKAIEVADTADIQTKLLALSGRHA